MVMSAALGIIFSAFQAPRWLGWVALVAVGAAGVIFLATLPVVGKLFPFEIIRKDPEAQAALRQLVEKEMIRAELQKHFGALNALSNPNAPELRQFSHGVMKSLEDAGFAVSAKRVEVQLADDAPAEALQKRKDDLYTAIIRMLIWDELA